MTDKRIKKLLVDKLSNIEFDSVLQDENKREILEYLASLVEENKFKEIKNRKLASIEKELNSVNKKQNIFIIPGGKGFKDPLENELAHLFDN